MGVTRPPVCLGFENPELFTKDTSLAHIASLKSYRWVGTYVEKRTGRCYEVVREMGLGTKKYREVFNAGPAGDFVVL